MQSPLLLFVALAGAVSLGSACRTRTIAGWEGTGGHTGFPGHTPISMMLASSDCKVNNNGYNKVGKGGCFVHDMDTSADIQVEGNQRHYHETHDCWNALRAVGIKDFQLPMDECYICNHTTADDVHQGRKWVTLLAVGSNLPPRATALRGAETAAWFSQEE